MLNKENLEQFTKKQQTTLDNVVREYCQHLFLSFLYQQPGSEKLLFKGGTALRIVLQSPRFSEDLDFTGVKISQSQVEELFGNTLATVEKTGVRVELIEAKETTGGYLGQAAFSVYAMEAPVHIEVSLRNTRTTQGTRALIHSDYLPAYTIVHMPLEKLISGKLDALFSRHKPRDFYDYFFLLSGNYPVVKEKETLEKVLELLDQQTIDFRGELRRFLPASHAMLLRDFKSTLSEKIKQYL
jgi:predicted nucleotidyltransferase component of viral defense system